MKVTVDGKEMEMSVLQAATGFRATAMTLDHNDLKVLVNRSDRDLVAYVRQLAARVK